MTIQRFLGVAILAASAVAGSANATTYPRSSVSVPFEFKVQGTQMPAGKYKIRNQSQSFVLLENVETGQRVHVLRENGDGTSIGGHKLKFRVDSDGNKVLERVG